MAEWGGASVTDAPSACDGLSAGRWVGRRQDGPRQLRLTDVTGGDEALVAASFGGYPREAHLSRQVGGWPHPTVLRFNCLSRRSRCTCHNG